MESIQQELGRGIKDKMRLLVKRELALAAVDFVGCRYEICIAVCMGCGICESRSLLPASCQIADLLLERVCVQVWLVLFRGV